MQDLSCGMQDLVPPPGMEPRPPALGVQSLSHWTTREVPEGWYLSVYFGGMNACVLSHSVVSDSL